uniref:EF-hand domain-containing protein n=1 Tax=Tetraselmis sp. GSL018 TaxID=582737 RepID=A0A061QNP4_9CHLO
MQNPAETVRNWFRLADIDQDGLLEGHEAVSFFKRSGLDANILAQIWEYAARGSSSLGLAQFWTAIQLVSLAQRGAKPFQDHFASVAEGSHPHLPLPRMDGLGGSSQPLQGSSVIPDSGTTGGSVSSSYSTHPHPDTWPQGHAVLSSAPLAAPRSTSHSGGANGCFAVDFASLPSFLELSTGRSFLLARSLPQPKHKAHSVTYNVPYAPSEPHLMFTLFLPILLRCALPRLSC